MSHAHSPRLVLASSSPRRAALLRQIGIDPLVRPSAVIEDRTPGEPPRETVLRLAEAKARDVATGLERSDRPRVVLAADTEVVLDGATLGKPRDPDAAGAMLRRLRGRVHEVLTGVFLLRDDDGRHLAAVESTRVRFFDCDDAAILRYVATGEPLDKAGAYGIQGRGALLVESVEGSWFNVVGLPIERLAGWLERIGVELHELTEAPE